MLANRFFNRILVGFIIIFGISAVTSSGIFSAQANSAVWDLNPQFGIKAVIAVPDTGLTTTEAGGTATFDVSLDTDPGGLVTVTLTSLNTAEGTVSPATMDFDSGDYDIPQTATVTGVDDAVDDGDQAFTIELTSTAGIASVDVTNTDDDPTVSFTTDVQSEAEDIGTMTITAQLSVDAASDVSVPYTLSGTATDVDDYSIDPNPLVITAGNLSADLIITVVDDALDEDDEDVVVTMGTPTNADPGATTVHTATIMDNDPLPTVNFTADSQTEDEDIGTLTVTAELSEISGRDVTVSYLLSGSATDVDDYSISPNPLVISAGSLSADLTITVVDDALDEDDEDIIVTIDTLTNADPGATTEHIATINDNDPTPTVAFTADSQAPAEESVGTMTITVELSEISGQDVTVPYTLDKSTADQPDDYTIAPDPLVIPAGDISAELTITVVDDHLPEAEETVVVTMDEVNLVNAIAGDTIEHTATITDNDIPGITILNPDTNSPPPFELLTSEDGLSDTFTVELDTQPEEKVTITLYSDNTSEGTIDKSSLTFTDSTWNVPQLVTITGVDDDVADDDTDFNIIIEPATSADLDYDGLDPIDVSVKNSDDDSPGFTVAPIDGLWTTEGKVSAIIQVILKSKPKNQVTLDISSTDTTEGTVSPSQIIVKPEDWQSATPYEIKVTGVDDTKVDGDIKYKIKIVTKSSDSDYGGKTINSNITNYDAPTIEWVSPVEGGEVYEIDNLVPILLKVKKVGQEPIDKVIFYRYDDPTGNTPTIAEIADPPYQAILYPAELNFEFNQVFAYAISPDPANPGGMITWSSHDPIFIFRRGTVYRVYQPLVHNK